MAITKRMVKRGFTLVELMIVVVIIGVLASLAIYGVQRYVANSKSAEARMMLGRMSKDMLGHFNGELMEGTVMAPQGTRGAQGYLCTTSTTVPAAAADIQGMKYQPQSTDWQTGLSDTHEGWACLGFTILTPINYMYSFVSTTAPSTAAPLGATVQFRAEGDLDGDGQLSLFSIDSEVVADTVDGSLMYYLAPSITESLPEE